MLHRFVFSALIVGGSILGPIDEPIARAAEVPDVAPFTLWIQPSAVPVSEPAAPARDVQRPLIRAAQVATPGASQPASQGSRRSSGAVITPWKQEGVVHAAAAQAPLIYHGGAVERASSVNFTIFWKPAGWGMSSSYQPLLNRYFQDIGGSPLYGLLTQSSIPAVRS
jgi:hypothetical protein